MLKAKRVQRHKTSKHELDGLRAVVERDLKDASLAGDACRRKRNLVDYHLAHVVTETELDELLEKAAEFRTMIEDCIAKNHPQLA